MHAFNYNASRKVLADVNVPKFFGFVSLFIGLIVAVGWIFDIALLTTLLPGLPEMKFNSALCFIFSGVCILSYSSKYNTVFQSLAIATFLIGFITLFQYILSINLYIDELFITENKLDQFSSHPGRMSPFTALSFSSIGFILLFYNSTQKFVIFLVESLKIIIFYIAFLAFIGYLFGIKTLFFLAEYTYISLPTSLGIILLITALYLLDKNNFYNKILWSKGSGGIMVRKIIPFSLFLPILAGLVIFNSSIFAEEEQLAIVFYILLMIVLFTSIIWYNGYKLYVFDKQLIKLTEELFDKTYQLEETNKSLLQEINNSKIITQQLNASEAKYRTVTENVNDLISILDKEGNYLFASNSSGDLLDFGPEELLGTNLFDLIHQDYKIVFEPLMQQILMGNEIGIITYKIKRKDNNYIWFESTFKLSEIDGEAVIISVSRDISQRVEAEETLKENTLQLEAANKELQAFSYSVSHDLRAPLRSITGFSRILVEEYESILDDEGKRLLQKVIKNSNKMGQLIDDLLAFSRLGRQEKIEDNIDIEALVKDAFNEIKHLYPDRKIRLNIKNPPLAFGDSSMLRQVIFNLVSNAIKYTGKKEEAIIEVGGSEKIGVVEYYFKDNGAGFDMAYVDKLFGVFQRLHTLEEFEGTGIGLALVQRIINRHGGRVWAEGVVEEGATFYFTLPKKIHK